jgi:transposase, IS5 family
VAINAMVPWESFRPTIEAVVLTLAADRKSNAGRKPLDAVLKFKTLVLPSLYNLSDAQAEYQARDRLSFTRFLGLRLEDSVPDATSLRLFREQLAKAGLIETLFDQFGQHLEAHGYIARGGQIVDATIVAVSKQRNDRGENTAIKAGETPDGWAENPHKLAQKDRDARWTKKHGRSHFSDKNHVNVNAKHKLVRHYSVTDANVRDSRQLDGLLDRSNTSREVFADSAYRSAETQTKLRQQGFLSRIHSRAARNHPLTDAQCNAMPTAAARGCGSASSMCSGRRKRHRADGLSASSNWCGPKPKSRCRTSPTTSGEWHSWSALPPPHELQGGMTLTRVLTLILTTAKTSTALNPTAMPLNQR